MTLTFNLPKAVDENGDIVEMMTINQFCNTYGYKTQQIYQKARMVSKDSNEPGLDIVYPYPDTIKDEDKNTGPTFILMNQKTLDYMGNRKSSKKSKQKVFDKKNEAITLVLHKNWEDSVYIKDMKKERGGDGVLFSLRMMQEIALTKNKSLLYTTDLFDKFINEYDYVKEQLIDLLNVSINEIQLFKKHKVGKDDNDQDIIHLRCPLYEDKFKF